MSEIRKFPHGGFDVTVLKKSDILNCIDDNIIDKDVAFAVIDQCERDAANFINEGKWTGIPYIGNIRVPKVKLMEREDEQKELIAEAKETLNKQQYVMFRKSLIVENAVKVKKHRLYNYITSMAVNANRNLYNKLCDKKGENFAKVFIYSCYKATPIITDEQQIVD